jgi:uncharacterized protein with NRDE domain
MCLIALAYKHHPDYPLIVAANRDEVRDRPAAPAAWWADLPEIFAGRDLLACGTWLGITRQGRFAAVTNHRDLSRPPVRGPSRGALVTQALLADIDPRTTGAYAGFNLVHGPLHALRYHNNVQPADAPLPPGIHGLSNAFLNTPWPKVQRAVQALADAIDPRTMPDVDELFHLLNDAEPAPDQALPDTGLPLEMERLVSSVLITGKDYGTRCSTVLLVDADGHVHFEERTHAHRPGSRRDGAVVERFTVAR